MDYIRKFNAREQVRDLGLESFMKAYGGKRVGGKPLHVLHFDCGERASLVDLFNASGFVAFGIDPSLRDNPRKSKMVREGILIPGEVSNIFPNPGHIPYTDRSFHLVVIHYNGILSEGLSSFKNTWRMLRLRGAAPIISEKNDDASKAILLEAMRVVRDDGAIVVYPAINEVGRIMYQEMAEGRWRDEQREVREVPRDRLFVTSEGITHNLIDLVGRRTVLYKRGRREGIPSYAGSN